MTRTNKLQGNKKPDKTSKHKRNKVTPEIVDRVPDMISTTNLDEASKQLAYQLLKGAKAAALNDPGIDDNGLSLPWQMLQQIKECQSMNVSQQARVRTRRQNRDPATAPLTLYLDRVKVPGGSMTLTKHATDPLREILKEASYAATGSHMSFTLNQRSPNPKRPASNQLRSEPGQPCLNGKPSPGLAEP
ncbi:hypothetical protein CSOJ01_12815 [Colletotrichum sojae]|uniref:Uncharacterized protein n=1 Tax=Colletotrichum sojae TaxID=2175907 RepID=A0A8H6ML36_9PEZI|nr:hypothetical protein CSOJ01_12815 [Colletotrichum sojae]